MAKQKKSDFDKQFGELLLQLNSLSFSDDAIDNVHDLAKASMNEVKSLTEYQDGKISRLLTVAAFLSAVVGAVFTKFWDLYPWSTSCQFDASLGWWLPNLTYGLFFAYLLLVGTSTIMLITAIRPSFRIPATWKSPGGKQIPTSMIFYKGILDVTPTDWGSRFSSVNLGAGGRQLKSEYVKNYIAEAYLIADKVAIKLSLADRGVRILLVALGTLVGFFILVSATIVFVPVSRAVG